jgi:hypothetical protein
MPQGMASACHWLLVAAAAIQAGTRGIPLDAEDTGLLMGIPIQRIVRTSAASEESLEYPSELGSMVLPAAPELASARAGNGMRR